MGEETDKSSISLQEVKHPPLHSEYVERCLATMRRPEEHSFRDWITRIVPWSKLSVGRALNQSEMNLPH